MEARRYTVEGVEVVHGRRPERLAVEAVAELVLEETEVTTDAVLATDGITSSEELTIFHNNQNAG